MLLAALAMALTGTSSATAQGAGDAESMMSRIDFDNVPLTTAIEVLVREQNLNYLIDPKLSLPGGKLNPEPSVSLHVTNSTAKQALETLLKRYQLFLVEDPVTTVARITDTTNRVSTVDPKWVTAGTAADTNSPGLITYSFFSLDQVIKSLAAAGHLDVTLDPKLSGAAPGPDGRPVVLQAPKIRWNNLTARQALAALLDNYDLVMVKDATNGVTRITFREPPAGRAASNANTKVSGKAE
jgi:hypothetical protein